MKNHIVGQGSAALLVNVAQEESNKCSPPLINFEYIFNIKIYTKLQLK